MSTFHCIAWPLAAASAMLAFPAMAQDNTFNRDKHFDGPYISGTVGVAAQPNDPGDTLMFDTGSGSYNDTVTTAAGGNAFSPGFCNGRFTSTAPGTGCSNDKDRVAYSGRIGYDKRMGSNIAIGALVEGSGNNALDGTSAFSTTPAAYEITRGLDYAISARARAGFTPGGGALFYGTGGISYAKIAHSFRTTNTANTFTPNRDGKMVFGYQAGGGTEVMLTDHISLGLEYLFNRYKDNKYYVQVGQGTAAATNPFILNGRTTRIRQGSENLTFHTLSATMSYRF
ncbi:outer membrane protein [Novosphingobium lentum]|uniref:outer membrane protein n=1 Tax=Novosphingobium lentum TaxID=145287 RepID=UPI0008333DEE|nr:outer membrane beta-barrel protein [Novosphingobium lentum]